MIIGISGRISSGKDTVGHIIQYLTSYRTYDKSFIEWEELLIQNPTHGRWYAGYCDWKTKKFADKLKDIVCILLNCTREQLEDSDFKNKELDAEWWYWKLEREGGYNTIMLDYLTTSKENFKTYEGLVLVKTTPRLLLQLLGTECGRNILHPNIWVNATMNEYIPLGISKEDWNRTKGLYKNDTPYPNWIISDVKFPNELQAVKDRGGISIRVVRPETKDYFQLKNRVGSITHATLHSSETALDDYEFDYVIDNNGTIEDLIKKVEYILRKEKLL